VYVDVNAGPTPDKTEDIQAERFEDNGQWIDFYGTNDVQLLRMPARSVKRIERLPDVGSSESTNA
jgi:hypothetical protein